MSAYKRIECSFKDKNTLIESLKEAGFKPVIYEDKRPLVGYMNDTREEKAEIIVPKNQISTASNDLGFSYNENKKEYTMICSDYDLHKGVADKVMQHYALSAIKSALKKNKFNIVSEKKSQKITINASKII
jgi:hypothetical protein